MYPDPKFGIGGEGAADTLETATTAGASTTKTISLTNTRALVVPTSQAFGNFQLTRDETLVNEDGQKDAVLMLGYNIDGTGNNLNPAEASLHLALESHFIAYPGAPSCMEFHLQSKALNGDINRHISAQMYKANGAATMFMKWDSIQIFPTNEDVAYFQLAPSGITDIRGSQARLSLDNSDITKGNIRIETLDGGAVAFTNYGVGAAGFSTGTNFVFNDLTGVLCRLSRAEGSTLAGSLTLDGYIISQGANSGYILNSRDGTPGYSFYSPSGGHLHFFIGGVTKMILPAAGVGDYADNAAAITAGLAVGSIYRTGDFMKIVH